MTEEDRAALAALAMRSLDTIHDDYGDNAQLYAACLVFEVRVPDHSGDPNEDLYHVNYKALPDNSPQHIGGLLYSTATHVLSPATDEQT